MKHLNIRGGSQRRRIRWILLCGWGSDRVGDQGNRIEPGRMLKGIKDIYGYKVWSQRKVEVGYGRSWGKPRWPASGLACTGHYIKTAWLNVFNFAASYKNIIIHGFILTELYVTTCMNNIAIQEFWYSTMSLPHVTARMSWGGRLSNTNQMIHYLVSLQEKLFSR